MNNCHASNACYSVHPQATLYHDALQLETQVQFYQLSTILCSSCNPRPIYHRSKPALLPSHCSPHRPRTIVIPVQRTRDTPSHRLYPLISHSTISFVPSTRSDHRRTTSPYISPTPCALTLPIHQIGNGNPCSSQSSSPFEPDLRLFALTCTPPPSHSHFPTTLTESISAIAQKRRKSCNTGIGRRPKKETRTV
jgi:hypothetical protein